MRTLLGALLRRIAPRTLDNLRTLAEIEAATPGLRGRLDAHDRTQLELDRRLDELDDLLIELREELDEARAERRRTAELHALVVQRLSALPPL